MFKQTVKCLMTHIHDWQYIKSVVCDDEHKLNRLNKQMTEKMNKTTFVAFSTQKGGAGKTTLTVLMASYLHYVKGINVGVIDCDFPQYSIDEMRRRDFKTIEENEQFRKQAFDQFKRIRKKAYPVIMSRPGDAIDAARKLQEMENAPEIIFFDLPGTMDNEGVLKTVASMDYIFCPAIADRVVMQSSLAFAKAINDHMITTGWTNIKGLYFVWNMVDGREKTGLYDIYDKVMAELGLSALKTFVPDSKRFRREGEKEENRPLFRSTLFPPDKTLIRGSNVRELAEEVLEIINV